MSSTTVGTYRVVLRNADTPGETWAILDESGHAYGFAASRPIAVRAALLAQTMPNRLKWYIAVEAVDQAEMRWTATFLSFRAMVTNREALRNLDEADNRVKEGYKAQRRTIGEIFPW